MIAAGVSTGATLGNGTLLIKTKVGDAIEPDYILNNGRETINFGAYTPGVGITPELQSQSLHLGNGVFTEAYALPSGPLTVETLVLRQHATCAYQSVSLPAGDYTHAPKIPSSIIVDGSDHVISNINGLPVPCMRLRAYSRADPSERYSYLGAYFASSGVEFKGLDSHPSSASNKLSVATAGVLKVVHCVAYGKDADLKTTRMVSSVLAACSNDAVRLRAAHTLRWSSMWRCGVSVVPKVPGDPAVANLNVALKAALYRVLSMRRDTGRVALSSTGPSWVPWTPSLSAALVVSVPDAAKTAALEALQDTVADLEGGTGDLAAPAMERVAYAILGVWNVFRVTLDRSWLRVSSQSLYAAANLIAQRIELAGLGKVVPPDTAVPLTSTGVVTTRLGRVVLEHGLTTHVCKYALSAATQMCYDLREIPPVDWLSAYNALVVPMVGNRYKYSAAEELSSTVNDQVLIHHPLVFSAPATKVASLVLKEGGAAALLETSSADSTVRLGALTVLAYAAPLESNPKASIDYVGDLLGEEVAACTSDLWRGMSDASIYDDLEASAGLLGLASYGFARLRVNGIIDRDGVHIQRSILASEPLVRLPSGWSGMTVTYSSVGQASPTTRVISNINV
jgi:hypothetical protein